MAGARPSRELHAPREAHLGGKVQPVVHLADPAELLGERHQVVGRPEHARVEVIEPAQLVTAPARQP